MSSVILEISDQVKSRFWIWNNISYDNLIIKTIWREYLSPDLGFTWYDDMSDNHKEKYMESEKIDRVKLLNI